MLMKAKVLNTIRKYRMVLPGEKVVLGVSGGPDSMALLYVMSDLRCELECTLHVAHLNHSLRGKDSEADAEYVEEHARLLGLPITVEVANVRAMIMPGESLESGARRIRYEFYDRVLAELCADKVALGHNLDDQAETIIMRLLRGSGTRGLTGIPPVRDNKFIRPLIEITRGEIEEYLNSLQVTPRRDLSNLSMDHERNRIRHELIPLLERRYSPNIKHILHQTGDVLRAEDEFLTEIARRASEKCVHPLSASAVAVNISEFKKHDIALQRRILRLTIENLIGDLNRLNFGHIRDLLELAVYGKTGSAISLPRGISAEKAYDKLLLRLEQEPRADTDSFEYPVKVPGETRISGLHLSIRTDILDDKRGNPAISAYRLAGRLFEVFDLDKIHGDLHLRNRRPGDRFQPLGMSGTKKLKDFFIDEKVPRHLRAHIPILTDGNDDILWIVGYRIDDRFKVTTNTKTRLIVEVTYSQSSSDAWKSADTGGSDT